MQTFTTASELIASIDSSTTPEISRFFAPSAERIISRAPGRLDLMGGIADYSGSLVLQWPIKEATWAVLQKSDDTLLRIASVRPDGGQVMMSSIFDLTHLRTPDSRPISYSSARELIASEPSARWTAYVVGVFLVLMHEHNVQFSSGARIMIVSDVPEGKGVSSSAAIEVATMRAVCEAFGMAIEPRDLGLLCQKVENEVVGAPCGVMDQMASANADAGALMALRCRPAELLGNVRLPDGIAIWGIDSGVRHSVSGADYGTVRTAAFMGLAILETALGRSLEGYLTMISPSEIEPTKDLLPSAMTGLEFASQYGDVPDSQSRLIPERVYPVQPATLHPVFEHFRVNLFREMLALPMSPKRLLLLGELMYQSHASYSACGLGTSQTDRLVDMVRGLGPDSGLYGAKITGGGSGGTVAVLGQAGSDSHIEAIAERYHSETGLTPHIFTGTSPGAIAFGVYRI